MTKVAAAIVIGRRVDMPGIRARRLVHPKVLWRACHSRSMRPVGQLPGAKGAASMRDGRRTCKLEKCRYDANTYVRPARPLGLTNGFHTSLSEA